MMTTPNSHPISNQVTCVIHASFLFTESVLCTRVFLYSLPVTRLRFWPPFPVSPTTPALRTRTRRCSTPAPTPSSPLTGGAPTPAESSSSWPTDSQWSKQWGLVRVTIPDLVNRSVSSCTWNSKNVPKQTYHLHKVGRIIYGSVSEN